MRKKDLALAAIGFTLVLVAVHQFWIGTTLFSKDSSHAGARSPTRLQENVQLCFVIRTYWGHGPRGDDQNSLESLLQYLVKQKHGKWQALLLVMDGKPFPEMHTTVAKLRDKRIQIFAELVGPQYQPKLSDGSWNPPYHDQLYNLTDHAIRACPAGTQWVVVTNGDNEYEPAFIPHLLSVPPEVGIVAFDFYSRYQRPTAIACDRFAAGPGAPPCKENLLRFCNTDLAADVYNWKRFMAEGRGFSKVPSATLGLNDGLLARLLVSQGWKVHRVSNVCLVSHSPNPQQCMLRGGVWDDHMYDTFSHSGGRCITTSEARALLLGSEELEEVTVSLSHDGKSFGLQQGSPANIQCIRKKSQKHMTHSFYPEQCAAEIDGGVDY